MVSIFNDLKERNIMTKLDELVSFILSDKLTAIRNFNCYDELVAEAKKLQLEQVKNINYDTVLAPDKDKLKIIAADGSEVAVCKFTRACLFKGSIKYCRTNNKKCEHSVSKLNTNVLLYET